MLNLSNSLDNCPLICLPSAFNSEKERQWFGIGLRSFTENGLFTLPLATGGNSKPNPLLLELVSLEGSEQWWAWSLDWWMRETWMLRAWFACRIWGSAIGVFCRKHILMDWLQAVYKQFPPTPTPLFYNVISNLRGYSQLLKSLFLSLPFLMANRTQNKQDDVFSGLLWTGIRTRWMWEQRSGRMYISTETLLVWVCSWNPFSLKLLGNRLKGA